MLGVSISELLCIGRHSILLLEGYLQPGTVRALGGLEAEDLLQTLPNHRESEAGVLVHDSNIWRCQIPWLP